MLTNIVQKISYFIILVGAINFIILLFVYFSAYSICYADPLIFYALIYMSLIHF
jgi:hypothetical protein